PLWQFYATLSGISSGLLNILLICTSLCTAWCVSVRGQLVQQHLGLLPARRVKPLGKPPVHRSQQVGGVLAPLPPRQAKQVIVW
ncbi:MAG: hypothetical protein V3R80_08510, partial [Candidatus Tectomicrobia bacterium]